jgi:hypothetical protein
MMPETESSEELSPVTVSHFRASSTIRRDLDVVGERVQEVLMRLTFCKLFVLLVLLCSYAASRITAQLTTPNGVEFKANSSFVAENVTFPAGSYNVKPTQDDIEMLLLSSADGHSAFVPCEPLNAINPATKSELTFHRYGNSLYLKQIWVKNSSEGCLIPSGHAEKKDRKSGKPTNETVPATAK